MNRWYPHLDYTGEPLDPGKFRDKQPTDPKEVGLRNAAIYAVEEFCTVLGVDVPPLSEYMDAPDDTTLRCTFIADFSDGRRAGIGYEIYAKPDLDALISDARVKLGAKP